MRPDIRPPRLQLILAVGIYGLGRRKHGFGNLRVLHRKLAAESVIGDMLPLTARQVDVGRLIEAVVFYLKYAARWIGREVAVGVVCKACDGARGAHTGAPLIVGALAVGLHFGEPVEGVGHRQVALNPVDVLAAYDVDDAAPHHSFDIGVAVVGVFGREVGRILKAYGSRAS